MAVNLSPVWNGFQFFDNQGKPLSGGYLTTCKAGSFTTLQTTYSEMDGLTANPNPIVLDSSGRLNTELWLLEGKSYNLVLYNSNDILLDNIDNVAGLTSTGGGGGHECSDCSLGDLSNVYLSGTYDGQVLTFDSGIQSWVARTPSGGGGGGTVKRFVGAASPQSGGRANGALYNQWSVNAYQNTLDVSFDASDVWTMYESGFCQVTIIGTIVVDFGNPWPTGPTMYGSAWPLNGYPGNRSTHFVLNQASPNDLSSLPTPDLSLQGFNTMTWTDSYFCFIPSGSNVVPQLYLASQAPTTNVTFYADIIIEQLVA